MPSATRRRHKSRTRHCATFALAMMLSLAFGLTGCKGAEAASKAKVQANPRHTPLVDVYEANKRSVVSIVILFPVGELVGQEVGAGTIISESGYILTNNHLLRHGRKGSVFFADGEEVPFRIISTDGRLDLAIFKLDADKPFVPARLGRSGELRMGEPVLAMGNPRGIGLTASQGIVSAIGVRWGYAVAYFPGMIATDARINPGNSGGALMNIRGEMVGVTAGVLSSGRRMGYVIPIDEILGYLPEMFTLDGLYPFELGMTVDTNEKGKVLDVEAGSPAAEAGIRTGDVIAQLDGRPLPSRIEFHLDLIGRKAGDVLNLSLDRDGQPIEAALTLGQLKLRPAEQVEGLVNGVTVDYYEGAWSRLPDFGSLTPSSTTSAETISVAGHEGQDNFGLRFTGYVKVPADGLYSFFTSSDDGSRLYIGDQLVVDNDGLHGVWEQYGTIALAAGLHPITVAFFEYGGDESLSVSYRGPEIVKQEIPKDILFHAAP